MNKKIKNLLIAFAIILLAVFGLISLNKDKSEGELVMESVDETMSGEIEISTPSPTSAPKEMIVPTPMPTKTTILVHVCGCVNSPGVYELQQGDRVYEAIDLSGGFTDDANVDYLNLADVVSDGMKIYVPTKEETANDVIQSENPLVDDKVTQTESGNKVSLNSSSIEELMTLPGVGESKARAIDEYRKSCGGFTSVEEIMNISGIKEGLFNKIKDYITL